VGPNAHSGGERREGHVLSTKNEQGRRTSRYLKLISEGLGVVEGERRQIRQEKRVERKRERKHGPGGGGVCAVAWRKRSVLKKKGVLGGGGKRHQL